MKFTFILFSFSALLCWSCSPSRVEDTARLDSLGLVIDKTELKLNELDTGNVSVMARESKHNQQLIGELFTEKAKNDTIWQTISQYGSIKKAGQKFLEKYASFKKEIAYSRKQLDDLHHDVKKNKVSKEEFAQYFQTEAVAIDRLSKEIEVVVNKAKTEMALFDTLNPKVISIIRYLQTLK